MPDQTEAYTALQKRMHEALVAEHPEWIAPDGESPMLDLYDARFAELLNLLNPSESDHSATGDDLRKAARA